jgi:SSS family solute:Na+ symporter
VALASILVYPQLSDIQAAFPNLDPSLLGHDIAYPAMLKFLPAGFVGLMVGGLVAANSSTILTHLNWGASYLVHDFYRRFLKSDGDEKHYVWMGRVMTVVLFLLSSGLVFILDSAKEAFDIILQVGAGTGLLYLVRWFWWRVNAWSEVAAMVSSFLISVLFLILEKQQIYSTTSPARLVITIAITTVCWLLAAYVAPQTDRRVLMDFYLKVRPSGPGWNEIRRDIQFADAQDEQTGDSMPLALIGWVSGCTAIWSALFTTGCILYGRTGQALALGATFVISGLILLAVINKLWSGKTD